MSAINAKQVQEFIRGYLVAALWSSTDILNGDDVALDAFEWAPGEAEKLSADCSAFVQANAADLLQYAQDRATASQGTAWDYAGHDFWLTRNRHGVGYWDRGLADLGDRLTEASHRFGELNLYLGDDELVHVG